MLLIAALMVLPVDRGLAGRLEHALDARPGDRDRLRRSLAGLVLAYYGDLPPGGTIVLVAAGGVRRARGLRGVRGPRARRRS